MKFAAFKMLNGDDFSVLVTQKEARQASGKKILIPPTAIVNIEHERGASEEEIKFQIKWPLGGKTKKAK
jgi:hypothetical protein